MRRLLLAAASAWAVLAGGTFAIAGDLTYGPRETYAPRDRYLREDVYEREHKYEREHRYERDVRLGRDDRYGREDVYDRDDEFESEDDVRLKRAFRGGGHRVVIHERVIVGSALPAWVELRPIPRDVLVTVKTTKYRYVIDEDDNDIIVVHPRTRKVVRIIER